MRPFKKYWKDKKVIITGATGGIGYSLVKKFCEKKSVVLASGTNEEKLNNLKKEFSNIQIEKFKLDEHKNIETFNILFDYYKKMKL